MVYFRLLHMDNGLHMIVFVLELHSILYGCSYKGKLISDLWCNSSLSHREAALNKTG